MIFFYHSCLKEGNESGEYTWLGNLIMYMALFLQRNVGK